MVNMGYPNKKLRLFLLLFVSVTVITFSYTVLGMDYNYFMSMITDNNQEVWSAKIDLMNRIYINNPDYLRDEIKYEEGIIKLLNLN